MRRLTIATMAVMLTVGAGWSRADVWDTQGQNDDGTGTENELVHGSDQVHDLASAGTVHDKDYYRIGQRPYSSWEVIVDGTSGDISDLGITLNRVGSDGTAVLLASLPVSDTINFSRSLRWQNASSLTVLNEYVRVSGSSCTNATPCNADDVYRLRALETTYAISRFNNTSPQVTFVMIQNTAAYAVNGSVFFWSPTGSLLATYPFSLLPKALLNVNTNGIGGLAGQSGSITVTNTGRYGDLAGKSVGLESPSGYSFDTPMVPRPN